MRYAKKVGRIELRVQPGGGLVQLLIPDGWNDTVPVITNELKLEELHDLRYLINRALAWEGEVGK